MRPLIVVCIALFLVLSACVANGFLAPPHERFGANVQTDCQEKMARAGYEPPFRLCEKVRSCVSDKGITTILGQSSSWRIYDTIVLEDDWPMLPIAAMRQRAKDAGPESAEMFELIYSIRDECLIQNGIRNVVTDE